MIIGLKRTRVILQAVTRTQDDYGDATDVVTTLATMWGSLRPLRGDERSDGQKVDAETTHSLRVRWSSAIAGMRPDDRFTVGSRVFDITAVMNIGERNREIEFLAKERF